jgi:hypothetical protein
MPATEQIFSTAFSPDAAVMTMQPYFSSALLRADAIAPPFFTRRIVFLRLIKPPVRLQCQEITVIISEYHA